MKKNILVVPAGTEIAHEVFEALRYSKFWNLIGANAARDHSEVLFNNLIHNFPSAYDETFAEAVNSAVQQRNVDIVIPTHDEAIFRLAGKITGALFAGPEPATARILRSKQLTIDALQNVVPTPDVFSPDAATLPFPVFAKPDQGQGSRGAITVHTPEQLRMLVQSGGELIIQELLNGEEVTIDCYSSRSSELLYAQPRVRERVTMGIASRVTALNDSTLTDYARSISSHLGLFGPWFFQMKKDRLGNFKLLEVASRVSGSMGFQRNLGVNLVEAFLHELCGNPVSFYSNSITSIMYDRALYEKIKWDFRPSCIYVDFDDTLRFEDGSMNHKLVGILYGCKVNIGSRIILLTRRNENLEILLDSFGIRHLFDSIFKMDKATPKSLYITDKDSVFIDDSFAERAEVARARGIPCLPLESCRLLEGCLR